MATWTIYAQLQNDTELALNPTDHIWLNGLTYGTNVITGRYQDSTHVADSSDVQRDTTSSVNNTKYASQSTVKINGAAAVSVSTLTSGTVPFKFRFAHTSAVDTAEVKFYAYDGATDATPMQGVNFYAYEAYGAETGWTAANGVGSALALREYTDNTTHDWFVAISASPTSPGAKAGAVKLTLTYA